MEDCLEEGLRREPGWGSMIIATLEGFFKELI